MATKRRVNYSRKTVLIEWNEINETKKLPLQKYPWPLSHKPAKSTPSGIGLSNLTPILDEGLSSKGNTTLPLYPDDGPLIIDVRLEHSMEKTQKVHMIATV